MDGFFAWWGLQDNFGSARHAAKCAWDHATVAATVAARLIERKRAAAVAAAFKEDGEITGSVQEQIAKRILEG